MRVRAWSTTISVCTQTSPSGCHSGSCGQPTSASTSGKSCLMTPRSSARRKPTRRLPRLQQELLDLAPDPFRRQIVERNRRAQRARLLLELALEPRRELDGAQHAKAVVTERAADRPPAGFAAPGPTRPPNGSRYSPVSGSKSIALIVKSRRRAASSTVMSGSPSTAKPRWPRPVFESRRGSETSMPPTLKTVKLSPTVLTGPNRASSVAERIRGDAEHLDVGVLRRQPEQPIPYPAADDEGAAAGRGGGAGDVATSSGTSAVIARAAFRTCGPGHRRSRARPR